MTPNLSLTGDSGKPVQNINIDKSQSVTADAPPFTEWLVSVAQQRDKKAFACLFKYFAPRIQAIAMGKLSSDASAKEVVQDTMTNVWRKAHLFNADKGSATTWIYTVMRNVIFDALRKIKTGSRFCLSEDIYPLVDAQDCDEDIQENLISQLRDQRLAAMVEQLPAAQQQVIKGVYYQELTHEQLAEQLNIPLGTVKSRLRLALAKLKVKIGDDHD